jgi:hypothetical protein
MGLIDVKKELVKLDKDKLIGLISELYKNNNEVKEYLDFYANPNEEALFEKYKEKVYEAFYPKRGHALKLSEGKKAISEFKKLKPSSVLLADLMFCYVETGILFTNDFGDIDDRFYSSLESVFGQSLLLMKKENLLDEFEVRANKMLEDTSHIGWGFYDTLSDIYFEFYNK